jgi:hypothetical protein
VTNSRRSFLTTVGKGVITISFGSLTIHGIAVAADMPKVDLEDPTAKALEYVHNSADANQLCQGCQLYTDAASAEWGPCAIFPGKLVSARGWCKSWVKRAG